MMIPFKPLQPVSLVGAGPGSIELLTLRGWHVLQNAHLVMYDDLIGDEILSHLPATVKTLYTGKRYNDGVDQLLRLKEICAIMQAETNAGRRVVRLKGGDPLVFARGIEEIIFLTENNIAFEIVPGITAAFSGAAEYALSLTMREKVRSLTLLTASTVSGGTDIAAEVKKLLDIGSNIMLYMGGKKLAALMNDLANDKPYQIVQVYLVSKIGTKHSRCLYTTPAEFFKTPFEPEMPVVIYLGYDIAQYKIFQA